MKLPSKIIAAVVFMVCYINTAFCQLNEINTGFGDKVKSFLYVYKYKVDGKWEKENKIVDNLLNIDWYRNKISIYANSLIDQIDVLPNSLKKDTTGKFVDYYEVGIDNQSNKCNIQIRYDLKYSMIFYISFDFGNYVKMYYQDTGNR